jgi:hypothetical protein
MIKYLNNECSGEEFDELWRHVTSIQRDEALEEGLEEVWDQLYLPKELSTRYRRLKKQLFLDKNIQARSSICWNYIFCLCRHSCHKKQSMERRTNRIWTNQRDNIA